MAPTEVRDEPGEITASSAENTPASSTSGRFLGALLGGKYRLERLLGQGAAGEVYQGVIEGSPERVAVKVLHPQVAAIPEQIARLRREGRIMKSLIHPNIARVLEVGEEGHRGLFYLVMELLSGRSLERWLSSLTAPPSLRHALEIVKSVLAALEAAHRQGVVHRDLKPGNVFLLEDGGVKILDFGLARASETGGSLTNTDMVAGTPQYMSPEQCKSLKVGTSTDVYAVGCILTELLQLEPPFSKGSPIELICQQMFVPPPPLNRPPGAEPVPAALEHLRLSLLAKEEEQRPSDVSEILRQLTGLVPP